MLRIKKFRKLIKGKWKMFHWKFLRQYLWNILYDCSYSLLLLWNNIYVITVNVHNIYSIQQSWRLDTIYAPTYTLQYKTTTKMRAAYFFARVMGRTGYFCIFTFLLFMVFFFFFWIMFFPNIKSENVDMFFPDLVPPPPPNDIFGRWQKCNIW